MPVVNVKEHFRDESEATTDGRNYRRQYTVLFDDPSTADAIQARQATGIPRVGDPHPSDFYMRVRRVRPAPRGNSRTLYDVEVEYATPSGSGPDSEDNPLDRPAQIRWSFSRESDQIDTDVAGNPIVTVNGESFDPPIQMQVADPVLVVTKNQATFNPAQAVAYKDAVNSDTFMGEPAGRAKIEGITAENIIEGDFEYWRVTYEIHFRRGTPQTTAERAWWRRILHQGLYEVRDGDVRRAIERDASGDPIIDDETPEGATGGFIYVASPVLLKADGTREMDPNEAHWLEFQVYESLPFSNLNIL